MDLTAEMIVGALLRGHADEVEVVEVCPPFRRRFGRIPVAAGSKPGRIAANADRVANRYRDYPRHLRALARREPLDVVHVVDQSYAQLALAAPPGRTVVTCHDLDAFRCLLRPDLEPRSPAFRAMARRGLAGFRSAAAVACVTETVRAQVEAAGLVDPGRLSVTHMGPDPGYFDPADAPSEAEADRLIGRADPDGPPILLHVGSTIPRKRIDVLLDAFAAVRRSVPRARLVRVGGAFSPEQRVRAESLGVLGAIEVVPFQESRRVVAAIYRRASVVLLPSEAEGFGLPLVEAMACGAPIVASDLPVLREVAGPAALYRPVGDAEAFASAAIEQVEGRRRDDPDWRARRDLGLARAETYRWERHAAHLVGLYRAIASARPAPAVC